MRHAGISSPVKFNERKEILQSVRNSVLFLKTKKDVFSGTNSLLVQVWAKCIENESMLATVSVTNSHWFNNLISFSDYIKMKLNL